MYSNNYNKDWYRYKELSKIILKTGVPRHCLNRGMPPNCDIYNRYGVGCPFMAT